MNCLWEVLMGKKTHEKKKGIEEIYVFRFYILD